MASRKSANGVTTLGVGLFRGARWTSEPYDDADERLAYVTNNCYLPDARSGSGFYGRPGFARPTSFSNGGNSGQGIYTHTALDGTIYNFLFGNGKVWRWSTNLTSAPTDVTPTNVTIATSKFIYVTSLADSIIVSDGVNKMWVGSNLGGSPITATVIEQQTPATILSIGSNDVRLANTAFTGTWSGTQATFAANAVGTAVGALGQIAANTWGIILVEASNSTTLVFTAAFNAGAGYGTEALAIAALPARTAGRRYVGYVTVRADAGAVWIAATDAFAGGSTGNQAQTTNYYAGEGAAYSVFGQPVIYYGAVFVIYKQVEATYARTTIGWSEPNQPTVGYQQTDYDNQWTLTQTGSDPLYALAATNDALYYSRALSWGAVAGAPGVNFQGTATHDLVSGNVGCVSSNTVKVFRNYVYFADQVGRVWRFAVGGAPEPLWLQARGAYESTFAGSQTALVAANGWSVLDPNLNLYLCASTLLGASDAAPSVMLAFDAETGAFFGAWSVVTGNYYDIGGIVRDANGVSAVTLLQTNSGGLTYVWRQFRLFESNAAKWQDNAATPDLIVYTGVLGYDGVRTFVMQQARVMQENTGPSIVLSYVPAASASATETRAMTASPATFAGRVVFTPNCAVGRGVQILAQAATATAQFKCYRIEVDLVENGVATVEDY